MIRMPVRLLLLSLFLLVTACATTQPGANPRTMSFPPLKFEIPQSQRTILANGMVIYLLEDHELPIINMTAYVNTGSNHDPADRVGLASLTATVMRSGGTKNIPPEKMDEELEFMASAVEASAGQDVANVSLSTLTKNLDRTLDIFSQVLMQPAFREDRFELARKRAQEGIRRQNDNPKGIADRELRKALYAGHPLGYVPTMESVRNITRKDLTDFHDRYFRPDRIILAVSGDIDSATAIKRVENAFAQWEKAAQPLPIIPPPSEKVTSQVLLAQKDVNQSAIRMGHLGLDKNSPDIYAVRVLDYILGGGFTSRLTQEIRSNQGLAYNVDSHFDIGRRFIGTFIAETETKSESTAKAIGLMRDIIAGMTREPVSDQELSLAKEAIINTFIFGFAKSDAVVNQQARLEFYGYPDGYLEHYRDNIARVTKEDVLSAARKYLHPEAMVFSVAGNAKAFDKPLETFAPVTEIKLNDMKNEAPRK